jgi:hypothetical protein
MYHFIIYACLSAPGLSPEPQCTAVRSLPLYETRQECVEAAGFYTAHSLTDHWVGLVECWIERNV